MSDYRKFDAALQSAGVCYETDEPMSAHTSFKIGGPADRFVEVKTVSELQAVLNAVSDGNVPVSYTHLDVYKRQSWRSRSA